MKKTGSDKPAGEKLLALFLPEHERESTIGDIDELYEIYRLSHKRTARLWYWYRIISTLLIYSIVSITWGMRMFFSNLKVTFRYMRRHVAYTFINIVGLAVGLACALLIFLWVQDELSVDRFHKNNDNLYMLYTRLFHSGNWNVGNGTPPALALAILSEYPEIVNAARIENGQSVLSVAYEDKIYNEYVQKGDFSLLSMFSFPLKSGRLMQNNSNPFSIYITERIAEKYFGDSDPVGKTLLVENRYFCTVAGVLYDIPRNSTMRFDFLVPLEFAEVMSENPEYTDTWYNLAFVTYIQLDGMTSKDTAADRLRDRIMVSNGGAEQVRIYLQQYAELYLFGMTGRGGRMGMILLFVYIGGIILGIACFNYMNLSTARGMTRAKEIGVRKVVGAHKKTIMMQFYSESFILTLLAMACASVLAFLFLPIFNELMYKELSLDLFGNRQLTGGMIILLMATSFVAGSYPAIYLSAFRPVRVLRNTLGGRKHKSGVRKGLVIMQFTASIVLIICTLIVYRQLEYVLEKDLGYNSEQLLYFRAQGNLKTQYSAFKQELLRNPGILNVTATQAPLTGVYWNGHNWDWNGRDEQTDPLITRLHTDADFLRTFDMEMVQGEFFSAEGAPEPGTVSTRIVINETLKDIMKVDDPVGMTISRRSESYTVRGVVRDFHFKNLYVPVGPLMIYRYPENFNVVYVRCKPDRIAGTIDEIEAAFSAFNPGFAFNYTFCDEVFERTYSSVKRIGMILQTCAGLAVLVSCLGLFGLASFMTERRTKEIGIRKTMGASPGNVILMLLKDFIIWVVISNVIAWPVAWMFMGGWLHNFAEQTNLSIWIFLVTGLISIAVAALTVSVQAFRASRINPVDALRVE